MNNGFKYMMPVNRKGEYITINEQDGRIVVCRRVSNALPIPSKLTVAEVRRMLSKGQKIDNWFMKHYKKWEDQFARENLDQYNKLINQ